MTVGSGWIGSSAVGETAQRWMSAAGPAINVGVPFWMSTLAGKSKGVKLTVVQKQVGVLPPGVRGPQPFPIVEFGYHKAQGFGGITGNYNGREIIALYSSTQFGGLLFQLSGAMSGSVVIKINGAAFTLPYNSSINAYAILNNNAAYAALQTRVGQTVEVTF